MEVTKKTIRRLVDTGAAEDWTEKTHKIPEATKLVFTSHGEAGTTGALLLGIQTGKLYAILQRSAMIHHYIN